jgi:Lar family restriction alleviation protein
MTKIKLCPFCGTKPYFKIRTKTTSGEIEGVEFVMSCAKCDYNYGKRYKYEIVFNLDCDDGLRVVTDKRDEAIEEWNRRITDE